MVKPLVNDVSTSWQEVLHHNRSLVVNYMTQPRGHRSYTSRPSVPYLRFYLKRLVVKGNTLDTKDRSVRVRDGLIFGTKGPSLTSYGVCLPCHTQNGLNFDVGSGPMKPEEYDRLFVRLFRPRYGHSHKLGLMVFLDMNDNMSLRSFSYGP